MARVREYGPRRAAPRWFCIALLAPFVLAAAGCGREPERSEGTSPSGGTAAPSQTPMSMGGNYEDTGLPKRITFDGKTWEISQDIDAPEGTYEKGTEKVNGQPVYHDPGAKPPYAHIYLRVPGKDRYLQYAPAGAKPSP